MICKKPRWISTTARQTSSLCLMIAMLSLRLRRVMDSLGGIRSASDAARRWLADSKWDTSFIGQDYSRYVSSTISKSFSNPSGSYIRNPIGKYISSTDSWQESFSYTFLCLTNRTNVEEWGEKPRIMKKNKWKYPCLGKKKKKKKNLTFQTFTFSHDEFW